jgi:hypothetical protein
MLTVSVKSALLREHPPKDYNGKGQFTTGDLHGNFLTLIHVLIRHGVIHMAKEDYDELTKKFKTVSTELLAKFKNFSCRCKKAIAMILHPSFDLQK